MNCCICQEEILNEVTRSRSCKCNLNYHLDCYNLMLNKNKFECAYCRDKLNNIENNSESREFNNTLFNFIFSLPPIIALPLWFAVSWFFVIFLFPFVFPKEIYNIKVAILVYCVYIYFLYLIVCNINE